MAWARPCSAFCCSVNAVLSSCAGTPAASAACRPASAWSTSGMVFWNAPYSPSARLALRSGLAVSVLDTSMNAARPPPWAPGASAALARVDSSNCPATPDSATAPSAFKALRREMEGACIVRLRTALADGGDVGGLDVRLAGAVLHQHEVGQRGHFLVGQVIHGVDGVAERRHEHVAVVRLAIDTQHDGGQQIGFIHGGRVVEQARVVTVPGALAVDAVARCAVGRKDLRAQAGALQVVAVADAADAVERVACLALRKARGALRLVGVAHHGRQRLDVDGNRLQVVRFQVTEAQADRFGHAAGRLRLAFHAARAQVLHQLRFGPAADAGGRVRRDVGRIPGAHLRSAQVARGIFLHQRAARRVARGAVGRTFGQVAAAQPQRRLRWCGRQRLIVEEQRIPYLHGQADIHRERQAGLFGRLLDGRHLHEVRVHGVDVRIGHLRIRRVRHGRVQHLAVGTDAAPQRIAELLLGVVADAVLFRWRDVGGHDVAHGRRHHQPASERLAVVRRVARHAVRRRGQVLAALDGGRIGGLRQRMGRQPGRPCGRSQQHQRFQRDHGDGAVAAGRAGHGAAAGQEQVVMVVRAAVDIHHGIVMIAAHDGASHDVLALVEIRTQLDVGRAHGLGNALADRYRIDFCSLARVVAHVVMDGRFRQAVPVLFVGQGQAVVRIGQHFVRQHHVGRARGHAADFRVQRLADQAFFQRAEGHETVAGKVIEAEICTRVFRTERALRGFHDAAVDHRTHAGPVRLFECQRHGQLRVVHHVAAHLVGAVGQAVRIAQIGRHQQQLRRFDAVTGQHEELARHAVRDLVLVQVLHAGHAVGAIGLQAEHHGVGGNGCALRFDARQRGGGVVLGAHRADRHAVVVGAAGRTVVVRRAAVTGLRGRDIAVSQGFHHVRKTLLAGAERQRRHRVRFRARRGIGHRRPLLGRIGRSADAQRVFGARVVRFQRLVIDGPVAAHAVQGVQAHVGRRQAPAGAGPVPGGAARVADIALRIAVGTGQLQVGVLGSFTGRHRVGGPWRRRIAGRWIALERQRQVAEVFHDLGARDARARFEHQHGQAGVEQGLGDRHADDAGADDDDVGACRIRHDEIPGSKGRHVGQRHDGAAPQVGAGKAVRRHGHGIGRGLVGERLFEREQLGILLGRRAARVPGKDHPVGEVLQRTCGNVAKKVFDLRSLFRLRQGDDGRHHLRALRVFFDGGRGNARAHLVVELVVDQQARRLHELRRERRCYGRGRAPGRDRVPEHGLVTAITHQPALRRADHGVRIDDGLAVGRQGLAAGALHRFQQVHGRALGEPVRLLQRELAVAGAVGDAVGGIGLGVGVTGAQQPRRGRLPLGQQRTGIEDGFVAEHGCRVGRVLHVADRTAQADRAHLVAGAGRQELDVARGQVAGVDGRLREAARRVAVPVKLAHAILQQLVADGVVPLAAVELERGGRRTAAARVAGLLARRHHHAARHAVHGRRRVLDRIVVADGDVETVDVARVIAGRAGDDRHRAHGVEGVEVRRVLAAQGQRAELGVGQADERGAVEQAARLAGGAVVGVEPRFQLENGFRGRRG
uniref:Uncharacterized protein n=1 Tax=Tanacetum cinerariifolium TaxID=118510 RepID=A0A699GM09_TANCI|nr:hypothetical protein [Tanacetum cinerariifolium]